MTVKSSRFIPMSFMGAPFAQSPKGSGAAILGIPFDCGTHPTRIGARQGPDAIRAESTLVRPYQPPEFDFNPLERLNVVDCGNVACTPGEIEHSLEKIEEATSELTQTGAVPATMGGDGLVTLPQLRAVSKAHADLVVIHIDAHTDTYPSTGSRTNDRYNTATTFTRAAEEQLIDTSQSYHIGARGTVTIPGVFGHTQSQGYQLIDGDTLNLRGIADVLSELHDNLAGRPVYLCFDMDFFDPSCAPGVCTPTFGGATAREGLSLISGLKGLNIVAVDVNTVSPPHDIGGMTAFLAATVMLYSLALVADSSDRP
ncbi:MAG: agmatinase [Chloroflexi bacterium]|nr:agmatinase [Chloroflexota bacterium]